MTLIALVPRLPPVVDGVGDYAFKLASQLHEDYGVKTRFVVADPAWTRNEATGIEAVATLPRRSAAALESALAAATTVLLHYVPHGYAPKACPLWLVRGLERWHRQTPQAQLITMFHELYALDWHRPWSSDFYLSPVQQHLAARVAHLSDAAFTNTEHYRAQLGRLSQGKLSAVPVMPVFSGVGELDQPLPLAQRQRHLVIFGQRHSKGLIYKQSIPLVHRVCQTLAIEKIWDIGPSTGLAPSQIGPVPVVELGKQPSADISDRLAQSVAGFSNYDPKRLGKSGVFAAYCAHGLLPINHSALSKGMDGLVAGTHYWVPLAQGAVSADSLQAIASQAHRWYRTHSLAAQARAVQALLPAAIRAASAAAPEV